MHTYFVGFVMSRLICLFSCCGSILFFYTSAQTDLGKAKEFLEGGFEAHGESTPVGAYFYLSNAYKQAGKPVPFSIPFVPVRGKKTGEQVYIESGAKQNLQNDCAPKLCLISVHIW